MRFRFAICDCFLQLQIAKLFLGEIVLEKCDVKTEKLIARLYQTEGRAEIVDGKIVELDLDGCLPSQAKSNILFSLHGYQKKTKKGFVVSTLVAYVVDLPHRKSFSPSVSFHQGKRTGMKFLQGAPIFAVEVRSENDYGNKAEKAIVQKRADYFAAGTEIVWDVDLSSEDVIKSYTRENPNEPQIFQRGEITDAEPALPNWKMAVDELFD